MNETRQHLVVEIVLGLCRMYINQANMHLSFIDWDQTIYHWIYVDMDIYTYLWIPLNVTNPKYLGLNLTKKLAWQPLHDLPMQLICNSTTCSMIEIVDDVDTWEQNWTLIYVTIKQQVHHNPLNTTKDDDTRVPFNKGIRCPITMASYICISSLGI